NWFLQTPILVRLQDGICDSVAAQDAVKKALSDLLHPSGSTDFPDYQEVRTSRRFGETACGPLSLIALANHLRLNLTAEQRTALVESAGPGGTDLLTLQRLAEGIGLHALGVEASVNKLVDLGLPAIVHLNNSGFAVATTYSSDAIEVIYPQRA